MGREGGLSDRQVIEGGGSLLGRRMAGHGFAQGVSVAKQFHPA